LRKLLLVVAVAALAGGTLTACFGGPPPQPVDPHDVLVVGDSVSFSFGCMLGDGNGTPGCPARPGYTTVNEFHGGCTIAPGSLILYSGGSANAPTCDTVPDQHGLTWQQAAAQFVPKVVVINTAGWEIVDRYLSITQPPDYQWGANNQFYNNAAQYYSSELYNAINMFLSYGAQHVLIANSPYFSPHQPTPPVGTVPAGFECSWWEPEPFNTNPPTAVATPGNPLTCPGQWQSPSGTTSFRSSHAKLDQFNDVINIVKNNFFVGDSRVSVFNFKKHFNGADNQYHDYICPPPNDSTKNAQNVPDVRTGSPTFGQTVWQCDIDGNPLNNVDAILARAIDQSHLSPAGQTQILQPYLEGCVQTLLGQANTPGDCT